MTIDVFTAPPWRAGERLEYRLRTAGGDEVGRGVLSTVQEGDRVVLQQSYMEAKTPEGATPARDNVAVTVDPKTLRPVQGTRETVNRDASGVARSVRTAWTYRVDGERTRLSTHVEREGAAPEDASLDVSAHAYDNESSLWLWRAIAFAKQEERSGEDVQVAGTYVSVNPFERTEQVVILRVPQREQITVPAGTFDTWRILVRTGRAVRTAWISSAAPFPVVRWDNGDVIFELTSA
ncbi:MAG: DUF3108 domain-containing protein [Dehalococcoidia bacterium]